MDSHSLEYLLVANALSVAAFALEAAVVLRMSRNTLRHELPMFFAYMVFAVVERTALISLKNFYGFFSGEYFLGYWFLNVVENTVLFLVIREIYAKVLHQYEGLRTLSKQLLRWAFGILVLIAMIAAMGSPAADRDAMYSAILLLSRSTIIVEFGLIVLLFVLSRSLSLGWRECVFGIAVGICFSCSTQMAAVSLRTHYRNAFGDLYSLVKPFLEITTLGIWTAYIYGSERARREVELFRNNRMDEWNTAVLQFLNR